MTGWFRRLLSRTKREPETEEEQPHYVVEYPLEGEEEDEEKLLMAHNPGGWDFPEVTSRLRFPDVNLNDLLIYSESSRSYALIQRHEHPQATADLVSKLRNGFTYKEATKAN